MGARALLEPSTLVKLTRNTKSPIAEVAVRQIAALYAVEATVRGSSLEVRLAARHSAPIIAALKPWLEKQLSMISSGSTLAEGSHRRTHGNAVFNPRIRVCSNVVFKALSPALRSRFRLPNPNDNRGTLKVVEFTLQ
jgi:hypothetical protein